MKIAAVRALCELAREPVPQSVLDACHERELSFGAKYIIPKPMDPRLLGKVSDAVARAAMATGVARNVYPANYPLS
jgi:malate dehydrogenase (oxaloacetate-decarboxylating)(NADP+)